MICANDIDRRNWFNIKADLPHAIRAHKDIMDAMTQLVNVDPVYATLLDLERILQKRIADYDDELRAIELRAKEHREAVTA